LYSPASFPWVVAMNTILISQRDFDATNLKVGLH